MAEDEKQRKFFEYQNSSKLGDIQMFEDHYTMETGRSVMEQSQKNSQAKLKLENKQKRKKVDMEELDQQTVIFLANAF